MKRVPVLHVGAAIGSLIIGLIHVRLYFTAYRDVPIDNLGNSFLLNGAAAVVAAALVLLSSSRLALLAPFAVANATLIAFGLSRTDRGIFGFTERGWVPRPDAALAVAVETLTAALCALALSRRRAA